MDLINNMSEDTNNGIAINIKYEYFKYSPSIIDGKEIPNFEEAVEYVKNGMYVVPYINRNNFYTGRTIDNIINISGITMHDWFINHINSLAQNPSTEPLYTNIILFCQSDNNYYSINYYPNYFERDTSPIYAVVYYDSEDIYDGTEEQNTISRQYDDCDHETRFKSVKVKDINQFSLTYNNVTKYDFESNEVDPNITILDVEAISSSSVNIRVTLENYGNYEIFRSGVCYSRNILPDIDGSIDEITYWDTEHWGSIIINKRDNIVIDNLSEEKYYYFRPFIEYAFGVIYGDVMIVKTNNYGNLTVYTSNVINSGIKTVDVTGEIYNPEGVRIESVGVCWNTGYSIPTINNNEIIKKYSDNQFMLTITGLTNGTNYNFRAFIETTNFGVFYGQVVNQFKVGGAPVLSDIIINESNISRNSMIMECKIIDSGKESIKESGFCYNTGNTEPTTGDTKIIVNNSEISFKKFITGLTPNTTYNCRAYSTNNKSIASGMTYSNVITGKTNDISAPILGMIEAMRTTGTSINVMSIIEDDGGELITEYGFKYQEEGETEVKIIIESNINGISLPSNYVFDYNIISVDTINRNFTVKSYAINKSGTTYSETFLIKKLRTFNLNLYVEHNIAEQTNSAINKIPINVTNVIRREELEDGRLGPIDINDISNYIIPYSIEKSIGNMETVVFNNLYYDAIYVITAEAIMGDTSNDSTANVKTIYDATFSVDYENFGEIRDEIRGRGTTRIYHVYFSTKDAINNNIDNCTVSLKMIYGSVEQSSLVPDGQGRTTGGIRSERKEML